MLRVRAAALHAVRAALALASELLWPIGESPRLIVVSDSEAFADVEAPGSSCLGGRLCAVLKPEILSIRATTRASSNTFSGPCGAMSMTGLS